MMEKQPQQAAISGLAELYVFKQKAIADGKTIFDLVVQEKANATALTTLVYPESLLQLILYAIDHRKEVTSRANQDKSAKQRTSTASANKAKIFEWCDKNPKIAWLAYKSSVETAVSDTGILASTSVREYISEWRKTNRKISFSA